MAPPRKHSTGQILDAARELVLRGGPRAASVSAIALASGAPAGTLYSRFGSRDGILAAAWLRALERFQQRALAAASGPGDGTEAAVAMARATVVFARELPEDAQLLFTLRRDDLLDSTPGPEIRAELDAVNAPLEAALRNFARKIGGRADARTVDAVTRAVVDVPHAAVRRHARSQALPGWLEEDVGEAARSLLAEIGR